MRGSDGNHYGSTGMLDGTVTLPLILARNQDPGLAAIDLRTITTPEQAERVCDQIASTSALEDARVQAMALVSEAKSLLPATLDGEHRAALELVADGVVLRYS